MKRFNISSILLLLTSLALGQLSEIRPAHWAQPLQVEGVPNLHRVSEQLYRSAQPTARGMANIEKLGIRTVVDLRTFHSDDELVKGTRLASISIPMQVWYPEFRDAVKFLRIVNDTSKTPVLVHCQHGADRTGTLVAVYRAAVQGWSKEQAIEEMCRGGFGYHRLWRNLPAWFRRLDITKLRREAGIRY